MAAVRKRLIAHDPFFDMKGCAVKANKSREHFVDRATAQAVLDACPDAEWRLIFALARFGGLRIPSELLALRWGDIDWARDRFTVHSSKTEHHEGGGVRVVPMFA
ncbi:MAG: site-specific integrase [Pirellulales bacterium]